MNRIPRRLCLAAAAAVAVVAAAAAVAVPAPAAAPASAAVAAAAADAAVRVTAGELRAGPPQRSLQATKRCAADGKAFYGVATRCCDPSDDLYDARGQQVCSLDGGISGRVDGHHSEVHVDPREGESVWWDAR